VARVAARVAGLTAAEPSDLVVLPELWVQGGFAFDTFEATAEPVEGPSVTAMAAAARRARAHVLMGSFVERAADGRLFNTAVLLDPSGAVVATYRKIHLFGFDQGEPTVLAAGDEVVTAQVGGTTVGLATCYDLRFPEMFRALLDRGAEVVLLPAAWPRPRIAHWRLLAQARAVENQQYVLACNTAGTQGPVEMGGSSLVVDPWGTVVALAPEQGEAQLDVDLDLPFVAKTRDGFPVLADRRAEVFR